jgi:hypothetical protein
MPQQPRPLPENAATRRRLLSAALAAPLMPLLPACTAALPVSLGTQATPAAQARLSESAHAHGLTAYRGLHDINVSYAGQWWPLIGRLQPVLVDGGFRVSSQERLLPAQGLVGQAHMGLSGSKQVWRRAARGADTSGNDQGEVRLWFNGEEALDADRRAAAALVADGYVLFLLGPLALIDRDHVMELGGTESVNGRACDVLHVRLVPGLGFSALERVALLIDREDSIVRSIRFSLDGLASTQGAVAEVETYDHVQRHGVTWPTRFYERLLRPFPRLPVHDWTLTGLDVNRGFGAEALTGPVFSGAAAAPAGPL